MNWESEEAAMILTLHNLAESYKMLPSEALKRASTFDLYVLDCHFRYIKYQESKSQGKEPSKSVSKPTQEQMLEMIKKIRAAEQQQGA